MCKWWCNAMVQGTHISAARIFFYNDTTKKVLLMPSRKKNFVIEGRDLARWPKRQCCFGRANVYYQHLVWHRKVSNYVNCGAFMVDSNIASQSLECAAFLSNDDLIFYGHGKQRNSSSSSAQAGLLDDSQHLCGEQIEAWNFHKLSH